MYYQPQPGPHIWQVKLCKICRQLELLMQSGKIIYSKKIRSLTRRRNRYLQKLLTAGIPLVKAGAAYAVAACIATQTHAQECNQFKNADAGNTLQKYYDPSYSIIALPAFVDIDGDGDLDCFTEGDGDPVFFRNVGTKEIPSYKQESSSNVGFNGYVAEVVYPFFADLDGDGDYDCFVPTGKGILYFENIGTKSKPHFIENDTNNPLGFITASYLYSVTIADIDNDGDYDIYFSDDNVNHVYKNTGTKTTPQFTEVKEHGASGNGYRVYYDWNKDGLIDYFVGKQYYRNIGPTANDLRYVLDKSTGPDLSALGRGWGSTLWAMLDVNNDGVPEVFTDQSNLFTVTPVPVIRSSVGPAGITLLHATPKADDYTYQWQRNGKDIPFATKPVLPIIIPGYYTVTITGKCGTGFSLPYAFHRLTGSFNERDTTTAPMIAKDAVAPILKAYPNPFTQQFTLELGNLYKPDITSIRITDIQGRTLSVIKATGNTLHLGESLHKGIYIVQALQNNIVVFTQKIIKQ